MKKAKLSLMIIATSFGLATAGAYAQGTPGTSPSKTPSQRSMDDTKKASELNKPTTDKPLKPNANTPANQKADDIKRKPELNKPQ